MNNLRQTTTTINNSTNNPVNTSNGNNGVISDANSSTTPLTASSTFTGVYFNCLNHSEFTCLVKTDVGGSLFMDISSDGVNLDRSKEILVGSSGETVHTLTVVSKFMRVRYTNGSTNQTIFRLQTIFHKYKSKELTSTTSQNISDETDVSLVRVVNDHSVDLSRGVISDKKNFVIVGRNPNLGTAFADIWNVGGNYNFLSTAATVEVVSNDANDDASGTGARNVLITGLDATGLEITEIVSLVGSGTSTATSASFLRVNRVNVISTGTVRGSNFDNIDIQVSSGGVVLARVGGIGATGSSDYGFGVSSNGIFSVPAGKTLFIKELIFNVGGGKTADVFLYIVSNIDDVSVPVSPRTLILSVDNLGGFTSEALNTYVAIPEKTDVWIRASLSAGTDPVDVRIGTFILNN